jgi:mono/diheme cytochrome c family protein
LVARHDAHALDQAHAAGISVPPGLDDPAKLLIGTEHFAAHCAVCHGAPGVPKGDIAHGLSPQPPDLTHASDHYTPPELFWILKHGIKTTGMPSWGDHSDDELWATAAFLEKLPGMTEQDYAKLVMARMAHGGHHQRVTRLSRGRRLRNRRSRHPTMTPLGTAIDPRSLRFTSLIRAHPAYSALRPQEW